MAPEMVMTAPSITIRQGSDERSILSWFVRDETNTEREISEAWVRDTTNTPRLAWNPSGSASLAVALDNTSLSGFSVGTGTATTDPCVATATGGVGPYTYAWNLVSWTLTDTPPSANSPVAASSTFTQTGIAPLTTESAVWTCTATDSLSNTAVSPPLNTYFSDV